ncbi:MAG: aminoglycoside phosphotransferase family protein [Actinomycetota bacterium]|nr:aminoglycoside phosphotransferase family protein [Actinomycetota bacterium]
MSLPNTLPLRAAPNWQQWWPDHAAAAVEDARTRLAAAVEAWELCDLCPLGDGEVAVVLAARTGGRDVVVKVNPRVAGHTDELDGEAAGLAYWAPTGAVVTLLRSRDDGATMLLERLRPGATLHDANEGEHATLQTLGELAARLHATGPPSTGKFAQLAESSLGRDLTAALRDQPEADELAQLLRPDTSDTLIHADLHSLNALQTDGAYKVIDPKPHLADRHADIWA